jgi:hypothetical protein
MIYEYLCIPLPCELQADLQVGAPLCGVHYLLCINEWLDHARGRSLTEICSGESNRSSHCSMSGMLMRNFPGLFPGVWSSKGWSKPSSSIFCTAVRTCEGEGGAYHTIVSTHDADSCR